MGFGACSRLLVGRLCHNSIHRWRPGNVGNVVLLFDTYPEPLGLYHCTAGGGEANVNNTGKLIIWILIDSSMRHDEVNFTNLYIL